MCIFMIYYGCIIPQKSDFVNSYEWRFLLDIEAGVDYAVAKGHTFLKGGEAAEHVGRDQDPKKMNFQNIVDDKE